MQRWDLSAIDTPGGSLSPVVLNSEDETARAVLVGLEPGQELGDHQVKEHAYILVMDGGVSVQAGAESIEAPAGTLLRFEPEERHSIAAGDASTRLLLFLAPWPGEGHFRES